MRPGFRPVGLATRAFAELFSRRHFDLFDRQDLGARLAAHRGAYRGANLIDGAAHRVIVKVRIFRVVSQFEICSPVFL
jgi:hypothetical protein